MDDARWFRQKLFPFAAIALAGAFSVAMAGTPQLSALSLPKTLVFWLLEGTILISVLVWCRQMMKRASPTPAAYLVSVTTYALVAACIASVLSTLVDSVLGFTNTWTAHISDGHVHMAGIGLELVEEMAIHLPACFLGLIIIGWLHDDSIFNLDEQARSNQDAGSPSPAAPAFWLNLKSHYHGQLLALEAQQHYIKVHTSTGTELVYYKFGDALNELQAFDGVQIHRSYWVARAAIEGIERNGKNHRVTLTSGEKMPISKSREKDVVAGLSKVTH
ncbi:LytTR family DNA-binding domain-containing protein [Pyruvatibacter sp.]|uniref:LytTR family DNA-binding domain-containing protein n=1 Tax=Pyruvatibacter sp. TaxID=1981328 RepID=UPI003264859F